MYKYFQHRYGGLYRFLFEAKSSVDKSNVVVYEHLYPFETEYWTRPATEFYDGRFTEITYEKFYFIRATNSREDLQKAIQEAKQSAKDK